jgi:hypothetical protein
MNRSLAIVVVIFCIIRQVALGGRESEYSDKYPYLTCISEYGASVFFSGSWHGRAVVVRYNKLGGWQTFVQTPQRIGSWESFNVRQSGDCILFDRNQGVTAFNMHKLRWQNPADTLRDSARQRLPARLSKQGSSLIVLDTDSTRSYEFPLPSANAFRRWRRIPSPQYGFEATIGNEVQLGSNVWFVIEYYDGEGCTGIGGLGLFDLKSRRFGLYRDKSLAFCSTGILASTGDTLIVATGANGEYGPFGCDGLVLINTVTGSTVQIPAASPLIAGTRFTDMKLINRTLWILSENGITSWDIDKGHWFSAKAESLIVEVPTELFRGARRSSNEADSLFFPVKQLSPGDKVEYRYIGELYLEIGGPLLLQGWVDFDRWRMLDTLPISSMDRLNGVTIWEDRQLTIPSNYIQFSPSTEILKLDTIVSIGTNGSWVRADCVHPIYNTSADTFGLVLRWATESRDSVSFNSRAFAEWEQEQSELSGKIPVLDTVLSVKEGDDLFELWGWPMDILDARWLPSYNTPEPTGISFKYHTLSNISLGCAVSIKEGKLFVEGKPVLPGESWSVSDSVSFTAKFQLLDFGSLADNLSVLSFLKFRYTFWMVSKQYY